MNISAVRTQLVYRIRRGGVPGCLGALCLIAALVFFVLEVIPANNRLENLATRRQSLQDRAAQGAQLVVLTPTQQLASFYSAFPSGTAIPDVLASIAQIATEQQVALELGEYAMLREQGARLDQLRITLPVKGTYLQLRTLIAQALHAQPALSLQSLTVRRGKVAQDAVDGRIVFLLFLEHTP
jgi:hypothetical protein